MELNADKEAGKLKPAAPIPVTTKDMSREKPTEGTGAMVGAIVLLVMQVVAPAMEEVCPAGHCRQMGPMSPVTP